MYEYRAKVVRVVDGDTLHLDVDLGLEITRRITVRLSRINCPEIGTEAGRNAKAFTEAWVAGYADEGGWLTLHTVKDRTEKYGRYLADILAPSAIDPRVFTCLNDLLVQAGHAEYQDY
jgi:micrococcal nuclease